MGAGAGFTPTSPLGAGGAAGTPLVPSRGAASAAGATPGVLLCGSTMMDRDTPLKAAACSVSAGSYGAAKGCSETQPENGN